ncbi:unnamed protein product [Hydatigera taeniaeformis]|uniref:Nucleolar complex protein 2 homolog n=1 Tax=Hydatigena taeniaeformis TaxID=6205 RepID=A0A0R3X522_HYDTA|nr:unnamed protein product [Hydatigera taeniaeformis]
MGLLEVYSVQLDEAYRHAFVFIRQLAISLRKAFLHAEKEETRSVYNWQFICSLKFWCEFVARNAVFNDRINSLIHPITQVILGAVSPGSRWIPLRFHLVECLHLVGGVEKKLRNFEESSGEKDKASAPLLVPSLPLLLDVFQLFDFNKRASAASNAPMDLRLMLHFSPSQRKETACMDAVAIWLHDLLTEALCLYANSVAFPEYSAAALSELQAFLKSCRVANFTRNFKALQMKAKEHVDFVKRKRATIKSLLDSQAIAALESALLQPEAPLLAYYLMHRKIRVRELAILSERFKFEGEECMKEEDNLAREKGETVKSKDMKLKEQRSHTLDEEASDYSDVESDSSYDIDDGTHVTHVSRSDRKKGKKVEERRKESGLDSDDADFDLNALLNGDEDDDDDAIASCNKDELKEFRIDDFGDSEEDSEEYVRRRQRIMREDPDLGALAKEESEVELGDEAEAMDIDMDSLSSGDESEAQPPPPKVRNLHVGNQKAKKFSSGINGGKMKKRLNANGRINSMKKEKENNWKSRKNKKRRKEIRKASR